MKKIRLNIIKPKKFAKTKILIKCTLLFTMNANIAMSQTIETAQAIFPPSPEASAIAEYAKIPIGHYTGVANINLPLMELKGKDMNIPVSLSYHSAGNKVNEISSSVGLGWTLQAGGAITRVVRGKFDDHEDGYVGTNQRGLNITNNFNNMIDDATKYAVNYWDSQPDLYYFNFLGNSGKFTFDASGDIIMMPEMDYKVLPAFGPQSTQNYWTIINKNGTKFKFGVLGTEREESNTESTFGDSTTETEDYISSWFLSSIETATGEVFNFEYKQGADLIFKTNLDVYTTSSCSSGYGLIENETTVLKHLTLKKISSRFGYIDVISTANRVDLTSANRITSLQLRDYNGVLIKTVELNQSYFNSKENCSSSLCKRLKLDSVDELFGNNNTIEKYEFEYNATKLPKRDSPEIDHWGYYNGNGQTHLISRTAPNDINIHRTPNESKTKAGILEKIIYQTGGYVKFNYGLNEYRDNNNNIQSGGLRVESTEYNGNYGSPIITNYKYARENNLTISSGTEYTKPKHKNDWIYIHSFINPNTNYSEPTICNGFRIYSSSLNELFDLNGSNIAYGEVIVEHADGSKEINKYTDLITNPDERLTSDYFDFYEIDYANNNIFNEQLDNIDPYGSPYGPPSLRKSHQRGMLSEKVIKDTNGNKTHQINHNYEIDATNFKTTIGYVFDQLYSYLIYVPNPNQDPNTGGGGAVIDGVQRRFNVARYSENNGSYRLANSIEKTFDGANEKTVTTNYIYSHLKPTLLKEQSATLSNGDIAKTIYTYPFDLTEGSLNIYDIFVHKYQIADYIKKSDYINNEQLNSEERIYEYNGTSSNQYDAPLLLKQTNFKKKDLNAYTNIIIDKYDAHGNILQYHTNDNVYTSIIWGYDNRFPIAKVENATYDNATANGINLNMSLINSDSPSDTGLRNEINKIRNYAPLSEARVTGYTYKPLIGLTSTTDPRNKTTTYYYDNFNRLQYLKNDEGNIVTENQYQYVKQTNGN